MSDIYSFPFFFRGNLGNALIIAQEKQLLEVELYIRTQKKKDKRGRMQPQKHNCIIKQINLSRLHGDEFFKAWDRSFEVKHGTN